MIRKPEEFTIDYKEHMRDGDGTVQLTHFIKGPEELNGKGRLFSKITLNPGCSIGYHLDREEPCFCAGRYYLVLRARPGAGCLTPRQLRLGGPLFDSVSPQLVPYLIRRRDVLRSKLLGLVSADRPDEELIGQIREDIAFYDAQIGKGREA